MLSPRLPKWVSETGSQVRKKQIELKIRWVWDG
jgi:hypothetical protein